MFSAMHLFQIRNVVIMRFELCELFYLMCQRRTFHEMSRGVLVTSGASIIERKVDHGTQKEGRCQWIFRA